MGGTHGYVFAARQGHGLGVIAFWGIPIGSDTDAAHQAQHE